MKCDKELKISNNILLISCSDASIYKHLNISDAHNDDNIQTTFKIYIKNYIDNITIIENLENVSIITSKIDNTFINELCYDYQNSLIYEYDKI